MWLKIFILNWIFYTLGLWHIFIIGNIDISIETRNVLSSFNLLFLEFTLFDTLWEFIFPFLNIIIVKTRRHANRFLRSSSLILRNFCLFLSLWIYSFWFVKKVCIFLIWVFSQSVDQWQVLKLIFILPIHHYN